MTNLPLYNPVPNAKLYNFGIFIFISILTLNGTYFRLRPADVVPDVDWLVFARLLASTLGLLVGIILIPKNVNWGFGAKTLFLYVLATSISAANCPHPAIVIGYSILLLGASLLMIGLVYHAQNLVQLENIEKIWFITVSVLILKDALTGILFPAMPTEEGIIRLGMGVTHATTLSLNAGIIFWLSFRRNSLIYSNLLWLLRAFLLYVIIGAISRVSIIAFFLGGIIFFVFKTRNYRIRLMILFSGIGISSIFFLSLSFGQDWSNSVVTYMKRNQDTTGLTTFTGRTGVWKYVLSKSLESPIIGHGYAISRLTIGEIPKADFNKPANCHNDVLEVFFNTGILGFIPYLLMLIYSLKWMLKFGKLSLIFSIELTLHAVIVIIMLLISSVFDARLSGKLEPISLLFCLYLLALDREEFIKLKRLLK